MATASLSLLQGDPATWGNPPVGKTYVGVNEAGQIVTKQSNGAYTILSSGSLSLSEYSNTTGNTSVAIQAIQQLTIVTVTGVARSVPIILETAGLTEGQQLEVRANFLALDNLFIRFYNTDTLGAPISQFQSSTGSGIVSGYWKFYVKNGIWQLLSNFIPAAS
jgi:hypothetical protein